MEQFTLEARTIKHKRHTTVIEPHIVTVNHRTPIDTGILSFQHLHIEAQPLAYIVDDALAPCPWCGEVMTIVQYNKIYKYKANVCIRCGHEEVA